MAIIRQRQAVSEKIKMSATPKSVPMGLGKYWSVKSVFRERKAKKNERQASNKRERHIPIMTSFFCGFIGFMRFPLYHVPD
jgi:hypothetical protein